MMRLILEKDDGSIVGTKEVPNGTIISDILLRRDYIATKLWSEEDIAGCLEEQDYPPTQENIDAVLNTGYIKALDECSDGDWMIITDAIYEAERRGDLTR